MKRLALNLFRTIAFGAFVSFSPFILSKANALELDWSGQFWSEFNLIHNYAMDSSDQGAQVDGARDGRGGYYVRGGGYQDANFQTLFLRLRPKLVVNDNIYIKSEWWVGDPIYGIFGNSLPYGTDQRQFYSSQSRGSAITAQRFWGEFLSDVGTFQVGRLPLHWGLGIVWNSGDQMWDRYMSTGDAIRWIAKFGSFSFTPAFIVNSTGNTIAGSCRVIGGVCVPGQGSGGVTDYSLAVKYENVEDEMELGVNIIKRLGGANQDPSSGVLTASNGATTASSMNFNTFDFYSRKRFNTITLGGEVPIVNGSMAGVNYSTFAIAGEVEFKPSDAVDFRLKTGYAPGQPSFNGSYDTFKAFFFHPNYHIGMIMFNYQLANFSKAQTQNNSALSPASLGSPYDNPIVDAAYVALSTYYKPWDKWTLRPALVYAQAPNTAGVGQSFYNYWTRTFQVNTSGKEQSATLGWEFDLGITFQWDEYFQFSLDNGLFFPGGFYAFSNSGIDNPMSPVLATSVRIGVSF